MFTIPPNKKLPLYMAILLVKKKTMVILFVHKGGRDTALEAEAQLYSDNIT